MSQSSHSPLLIDPSIRPSETESLKNSIGFHVKYGSTGSDHKSTNKYKYLTHSVQPTDTLQGLALRYEVTMEQIKRANNLWSSDNLSLRSRTVVSIPVLMTETTIDSPLYSSSSTTSSPMTSPKDSVMNNGSDSLITANHSSLESVDINDSSSEDTKIAVDQSSLRLDSTQTKSKLKNGFRKNSILVSNESQSNHLDSYETNEETDESAADFLIRIDSSIAKSKDKVKDMQQNRLAGTHSDDDLFRLNHSAQRSGLRRHHSNASRPHSANSGVTLRQTQSDFPQPLVMMSHKRKVKSSLKRLERTQDEIFEL